MDPLDYQLAQTSAPRANSADGRVSARPAVLNLSATLDGHTRRWNDALRVGLHLYAAVCVRKVSARFAAPLPPGPKIIALNHANVTDVFLLPSVFPGNICFL